MLLTNMRGDKALSGESNMLINGKPAVWPDYVLSLWKREVIPLLKDSHCVIANFFTARPYRNEYDKGSDKFGFTYTLQPGNRVFQCILNPVSMHRGQRILCSECNALCKVVYALNESFRYICVDCLVA